MPTSLQMSDVLNRLRSGSLDAAIAATLEHTSAEEFIAGLAETYPVLFQERRIGRKREVGMARAVRFECLEHKPSKSFFPVWHLVPVLWKCVFVSAYDDAVSEVTIATSVHVRPAWTAADEAVLKLRGCRKIDKTPDGWIVKTIKHRSTTLSGEFLRTRGWKFDVLQPFLATRRA
jgi:hypothetical protein